MLKIQVLGAGLIPRGYGLAPRKEPFFADLTLIQTILATPGLSVKMISPLDGHSVDITNGNIKRLWDKYSDYQVKTTDTKPEAQTAPVVPQTATNVQQEKKTVVEQKAEETKSVDNQPPKAAVINTNNKANQNNNNGGNKNNSSLKPVISDEKKN